MPSTVKVRVKAARNLPFAESKSRATAPGSSNVLVSGSSREVYVVVSLGGQQTTNLAEDEELDLASSQSYKGRRQKPGYAAQTRLAKRLTGSSQLATIWEEDFRFDVSDDRLLQEEPLIFKVCVKGSGTSRVNVMSEPDDGDPDYEHNEEEGTPEAKGRGKKRGRMAGKMMARKVRSKKTH